MNSFKSGSGDLDFGGGESENEQADEREADRSESEDDTSTHARPPAETDTTDPSEQTYPYFVRRSNVTDERDVRLEAHVRETVASRESTFRAELAAALDTDDIAKTDAREFALLYAFEHPEAVAELMREEGFGAI